MLIWTLVFFGGLYALQQGLSRFWNPDGAWLSATAASAVVAIYFIMRGGDRVEQANLLGEEFKKDTGDKIFLISFFTTFALLFYTLLVYAGLAPKTGWTLVGVCLILAVSFLLIQAKEAADEAAEHETGGGNHAT